MFLISIIRTWKVLTRKTSKLTEINLRCWAALIKSYLEKTNYWALKHKYGHPEDYIAGWSFSNKLSKRPKTAQRFATNTSYLTFLENSPHSIGPRIIRKYQRQLFKLKQFQVWRGLTKKDFFCKWEVRCVLNESGWRWWDERKVIEVK